MFSTDVPLASTRLTLVSGGALHRDGYQVGALLRRARSIAGRHGKYDAEGFAVVDRAGVLQAWTLHQGDALQLAYALPSPDCVRHADAPLFRVGEAVATGFGVGTVTGFYRRDIGCRAHWRYSIAMDSGGTADAAQAGVRVSVKP